MKEISVSRGWSTEEVEKLKELIDQGKSIRECANALNRSYASVKRKRDALRHGHGDRKKLEFPVRKWTKEEILQLDAYLQAGKTYVFISERLNRSLRSIEYQAKRIDWKAWRLANTPYYDKKIIDKKEKEIAEIERIDKLNSEVEQYSSALLTVCRYDFDKLNKIKEKEFFDRVNCDRSMLNVSFDEIKKNAIGKMDDLGLASPENISLGKGTYIIVGDSHGKHTRSKMFKLIKRINSELKIDKIIHVGNILDDDNDISYDWGNFDNLVILAKTEELKTVHAQRNKFNFKYNIVRENVYINDIVVENQDLISDYSRTSVSTLDSEVFYYKTIVNCHRLEFINRCSHEGNYFISSPGCLCENHKVKTIKQIDFTDGRIVKQANHEGFIKYRRMKHTGKYWEKGFLLVNVDKNKNTTVVPCQIKKIGEEFVTSVFDKIIASNGVFKPEKKTFVNADLHCDMHDVKVLDIQERICKDYKPDVSVNLGDTFNFASLNHHALDRGAKISKNLLNESAQTYYILKRLSSWAKKNYIIYGNHERFSDDFVEKNPQLKDFVDFKFMCDLDGLGYELIPIKNALKLDDVTYIHGEIRMYGQSGSKLEKASRTFGRNIFIGHIHKPEIRFGCCSIGLSGLLDQDYNEPDASNWAHGFGLANYYKGHSFITTIMISQNNCVINGKTYTPKDIRSWNIKKFNARIVYDFEK